MPESLPPPVAEDDQASAPGWYPDPHSPDLLRWWDGEEWSETDFRLRGDHGIPWWHPGALKDRIGPFTRVGSVVNVVICGFLAASTLSSGFARDLLGIAPLLGMEAIFIGIAVRVWWRGRIRLDEND